MALHEQSAGATDEWYTPTHVFEALNVRFDLDPATAFPPDKAPAWQWCRWGLTCVEDGLTSEWRPGFVWLNPPFGGRNGIIPWLDRFMAHGNGVALTPDRTSAPWWQTYARQADAILFISPKLKFIGADGLPGRSPAQGTSLMAKGARGVEALRNAERNGLGLLLTPCIDARLTR